METLKDRYPKLFRTMRIIEGGLSFVTQVLVLHYGLKWAGDDWGNRAVVLICVFWVLGNETRISRLEKRQFGRHK